MRKYLKQNNIKSKERILGDFFKNGSLKKFPIAKSFKLFLFIIVLSIGFVSIEGLMSRNLEQIDEPGIMLSSAPIAVTGEKKRYNINP